MVGHALNSMNLILWHPCPSFKADGADAIPTNNIPPKSFIETCNKGSLCLIEKFALVKANLMKQELPTAVLLTGKLEETWVLKQAHEGVIIIQP